MWLRDVGVDVADEADDVVVSVSREVERDPLEVELVVVADFDLVRLGPVNRAVDDEVAVPLVEIGKLGVRQPMLHAHHHVVTDEADRVVVRVKLVDDPPRLIAGVGDRVQRSVAGGLQSMANELLHEAVDGLLVGVARLIEQHDRNRHALAGLRERQ